MTIKTKLILSAALVAILSAPASARPGGEEGHASAFPRFGQERTQMTGDFQGYIVNRPFQR